MVGIHNVRGNLYRDAELDRLLDEIVARFPGGLTPEQYRRVVLESADEDGLLYLHSLANWWHRQSLLMGMFMEFCYPFMVMAIKSPATK